MSSMRIKTKFSGRGFCAEAAAAPPRNCRNCRRSISGGYHRLQIPPTNHACQVLVITGARPVRLETHPAFVAVMRQRGELAFPIDATLAERTPNGLVPFHV